MHFASIKNCDIANGEGVRVSLFVSGCTHKCEGCFNPQAWDFNYGDEFTEKEIDPHAVASHGTYPQNCICNPVNAQGMRSQPLLGGIRRYV
jgi:organic radical activating enzyme